MQEVNEHFTGVALELWPDPGFEPRKEKTHFPGPADRSGHGLLAGAGQDPHAVAGAADLRADRAAVHAVDPGPRDCLARHQPARHAGHGLFAAAVHPAGRGHLRTWMLLAINTSIRVQWKANIFTHLLRLPLDYFQKRHLGDIVSRTNSIDEIQRVLTSAFVESLLDGLMMVLTLVMMFIYNPTLGWIAHDGRGAVPAAAPVVVQAAVPAPLKNRSCAAPRCPRTTWKPSGACAPSSCLRASWCAAAHGRPCWSTKPMPRCASRS
jgi:ATP-binding cassette subfamily B protein RaxB